MAGKDVGGRAEGGCRKGHTAIPMLISLQLDEGPPTENGMEIVCALEWIRARQPF